MILQFILIIIIASYLRKWLRTSPGYTQNIQWLLLGLMIVSIPLSIVPFVAKGRSWFVMLGILVLAWLLWFISKNTLFKSYRFLVTAILPYLIASFLATLVNLVNTDFYNSWQQYFKNAEAFSVLWGLGVWFVTRRQRKELEKTKQKIEEQKQSNTLLASMRDELEVQVKERTAELTKQKEELEITVHELKSAQAQLIQSEKMASLGELTAGIAHEIQNPLNFVNNFSEVNKELLTEIKEEIEKKNYGEVTLLIKDAIDNEEKIALHGRRADGIVKSMLQHSRKNTGQKEPTDINALCDEYIRLSYHGLRAKDKTFNADFKTDFDESIGKINIVPQDVGRVLLNLFNNAFHAVNAKKKMMDDTYRPAVSVTTKKENKQARITVKDNGSGIPRNIIDKIFQPFFTTKPTGEGTGLGLSLSYDIITKEHSGTIKAESIEGEETTVAIEIPA